MFLSENIDFVLFLLVSDLALSNFFDKLLIFTVDGSNALDFICVLPCHYSDSNFVLVILVSLYHQCFQEDIYLIHVIQF